MAPSSGRNPQLIAIPKPYSIAVPSTAGIPNVEVPDRIPGRPAREESPEDNGVPDANWIITTPVEMASQPTYARVNISKRRRKSSPQEESSNRRQKLKTSFARNSSDDNDTEHDIVNDNESENEGESHLESDEGRGTGRDRRKQRKARVRAGTPDGAELVTIVPSIVTMHELASRDRRTGIKSERERKMRAIDWSKVKERRKKEEIEMAERGRKAINKDRHFDHHANSDDELDEDATLQKLFSKAAKDKGQKSGIKIKLVNGQQVIDEQSQRIDFHALANEDVDNLEAVEEDDLTSRFNSQTYINMKRREPAERIPNRDKWTDETTEKFFACISRYGTDFMIISKMFPGRSRRQIRAKFVKEERLNPSRVQLALADKRTNWDIETFKTETGLGDTDFHDPREIEKELRKRREEREVEIEEARRQTAETKRQRRLAGQPSSDEDEDDDEEGDVNTYAKTGAGSKSNPTELVIISDNESE